MIVLKSRNANDLREQDVTAPEIYRDRRRFMQKLLLVSSALLLPASRTSATADCSLLQVPKIHDDEKTNSFSQITHYNNFYEYSTDKEAVATLAENLQTRPWQIRIEGEVEAPTSIDIEALLGHRARQERIYRLRCVEGWSMVIPWQGIPLCHILRQVKPTSKARYVEFISKLDPATFYGQRRPTLDWPYREGLRIDEAMHPLTLLATGLYGQDLPAQNGAPVRLVVPWKYGFKSIKSIVKIRLTEKQPVSSWSAASASEYGFYANVNPAVSHPRWSQRRETRIGEIRKRRTLMFNGYADEVADLYAGMDLQKFF